LLAAAPPQNQNFSASEQRELQPALILKKK
jgi:hypothetical protein